MDEHVVDQRASEQRHVAEDARQPPHVLILEVAARGPLVNPHRQQVLSGLQQLADVELTRQPAPLRRTDLGPVQPHLEAGVDPVEAQYGAVRRPVVREIEPAPVIAGRVRVRRPRWVDREREGGVRVPRPVVALERPVPGDLQFAAVLADIGHRRRVGRVTPQLELPPPVQAEPRSRRPEPGPRFAASRARRQIVEVHPRSPLRIRTSQGPSSSPFTATSAAAPSPARHVAAA